ncbi:TetR/AcrR family transcriptional regulator [Spongiactinospora gelatinilytica]|uniref:TetR/AcrR family transcriptional regulator n=1 Tax=Spongiactinospora gelatinilytica TaxID=2666298 RepID=A0A2W2FPI4_9ACTN|nr:TetR/AcrR family transcriptional regulator [Spongiactinospora gelatinilytica]PZG26518.1 TetR/AcrR family transcriptional regulator [Spongiactinospora gelatinilytica]
MATPSTRLSKQARREQLLDAATAFVRAHGPDGLTLPSLAEAAKVSRPIVYDHFGTRHGLLLALYLRLDEQHRAALTEALKDAAPTPHEVARVISGAYFACATAMPELNAVAAALRGIPELDAMQHEVLDRYIDLMAEALVPYSAVTGEALRLRCIGVLGAADAIAAELTRGRVSADDAVTALADLLLSGLDTGSGR